jgi:ubiquinone/menaquinone biosynthesis C-methylase UbiE
MEQTSFDMRIVRYEDIHSIRQEHFDTLCSLVNPFINQKILDLGSGYGACTRELIKHYPSNKFIFTLTDNSDVQLERSKKEIPQIIQNSNSPSLVNYDLDDITTSKFSDNTFDVIIAKMVIHEINKNDQLNAIKEIFRILKPGGKLIYWDLYLNHDTQLFFQSIITEKDRLCGFETLCKNRYFLTGKEILDYLLAAGFSKIIKEEDIMTPVVTSKRLKDEFKGDESLLNQWHNYIHDMAKNTNPYILFNLSFKDFGTYLSITPPKAIITAFK